MADPRREAQETRDLISYCLLGQPQAVRKFQQDYGKLIYGYPIRVYRMTPEDAGDFYVFAFQDGRVFQRLRYFEGRAPLKAYLLGFVLDDLVLEWKRSDRKVEPVSVDDLGPVAGSNGSHAAEETAAASLDQTSITDLLAGLPPAKAVVMKLLHVEACELGAAEVQYLAEASGRAVPEVLAGVAHLRALVREREAGLQRLRDDMDAVQAWIHLYERRMAHIHDDLRTLPFGSAAALRLREEAAQLEHKLERRRQQHVRLSRQAQRRKLTAPYKDIAALLRTSVGNVCSQIARIRREVVGRTGLPDRQTDRQTGIERPEAKGVRS